MHHLFCPGLTKVEEYYIFDFTDPEPFRRIPTALIYQSTIQLFDLILEVPFPIERVQPSNFGFL